MKKVTKKLSIIIDTVAREEDLETGMDFTYTFKTNHLLPVHSPLKLKYKTEEPSTVSEFIKHYDISEKEFFKWASKHFNKL